MTRSGWTLTIDCADAPAMARFWALALGYVEKPPPEGWDTWEEWLKHFEVPEEEWANGASLVDPAGVLPGLSFLRVPEPKTVKNRLHIDVQVLGVRHVETEIRVERIEEMVATLVDAGATEVERLDQPDGSLDHVLMADPEGNEFCVV